MIYLIGSEVFKSKLQSHATSTGILDPKRREVE
jgi:hypothetical protein